MARAVRASVRNGWYHVTARGIERRTIFSDDKDHVHFLELLKACSERYAVEIHAFVCIGNHYHLLVRTPERNLSRAMQWLHVSYSVWFNKKRQRVGPVFQGRFKSVLIDNKGSWLLEASAYLHLNPVRVKALGLGKASNRAEALGWKEPDREQIQRRLEVLRRSKWNSYGAYAGYKPKPGWLKTDVLLKRAGGKREYRRYVTGYVTRGLDPGEFKSLRATVAIGRTSFVEQARRAVKILTKEQPGRKELERLAGWDRIVGVVERERGEKYAAFANRHGDSGRDLVLYLARHKSGLTLRQIGELAGGLEYKTVGKAVQRCENRMSSPKTASDRALCRIVRKCERHLSNVEIRP